jgi:hypothetical protein
VVLATLNDRVRELERPSRSTTRSVTVFSEAVAKV